MVTILVLVENPLQFAIGTLFHELENGHNPCFSGKPFAIAAKISYFYRFITSESVNFQPYVGIKKLLPPI